MVRAERDRGGRVVGVLFLCVVVCGRFVLVVEGWYCDKRGQE